MKKKVRYFCLVDGPFLVAVGCSSNSRDASVSYSPTLTSRFSDF
jgi:hypothetical protein